MAAVFLNPVSTFAQSGTGDISGRVSNAESGRSLQGAVVRVADTNFVDYTDIEGRFSITGVPAGQRRITVSYVGLESLSQSVNVTSGQATILEFPMEGRIFDLPGLEVTPLVVGQERAINQQKTAAGIINVVSEEQFGALVDGNIGQALQRLPGISVNEDQDGSVGDINIRGVAGEFNSVQIDGNRIPSSGGSRAFNPRQLSADGITNIEVIKAPTPDRDGDAVGGIVNLVTRTAFQRGGREMSLKVAGILNDEPAEWGSSGVFNFSDIFSVGEGNQNLGVSFSLSRYDTDRYSRNADMDWIQVTPELHPELNLGGYDEPVWFMESTHWEYDTRKTDNYSINASIDFRTDENNSFYFRPSFSRFERNGVKYETDIDIDTAFDNDGDPDEFTYAVLTPTYGRGTVNSEASRGWIGTLDDEYNNLYTLSAGGRHEGGAGLLTYDFFYSKNKNIVTDDTELNMLMEPDDPWFVFEYEIVGDINLGEVEVRHVGGGDPTDLSQMTEGELEEVSEDKIEEIFSGRIDWESSWTGDNGVFTLKTGAKYRDSSQFRDETVNLYEMDEDFPYSQVLKINNDVLFKKTKYFDVQPQIGKDLRQSNPELFEFVEDDSLEDSNVADYDATETTSAAYIMGTYEFGPHSIIGGVRYERNEWDNVNKIVSYLDDNASVTTMKTGNSYSFWLPGIHGRHEFSENLILRESYNKSYGRPRLEELSRGRWVDDDGNIEDGNPDLKPAKSDNYDIQLEYYTDQGGLYSIGLFYKDIKDFTFTQTYDFDEIGPDGIPIPLDGGDLEYERPVNGTTATNKGIELIARQQLYFLPGALSGLAVRASATFSDSKADYPNRTDRDDLSLEGFSDEIYTLALDYAWSGFSARVDYTFRSDYIEGLGDDIESDEFFGEVKRVDAEIAYQIRPGFIIFATGANITDEPLVSYQGYPMFVEDASLPGPKYTFGAEFRF
ncbi:MAG: TonB-dependent receptor [Verrucomicrobiae bacterium]|nr:TonB-dependent receptor [Verrucomicrobiae bacterium]